MLSFNRTSVSTILLSVLSTAVGGESANPALTAEALPSYVMGFPVLIVLEARGPQMVPMVDLTYASAEVEIVLSEKAGDRRYMLKFDVPDRGSVTTADGHGIDPAVLWRAELSVGVRRRMVLDLCSLRQPGKEMTLDDVQDGTYDCEVVFPVSGVRSNVFAVTFTSPTRNEEALLKVLRNRQRMRRNLVSWDDLLIRQEGVPGLYLGLLRKETVRQLALHVLLLGVNASKVKIKNIDIDVLNDLEVPAYLAPEKECFLVEIGLLSGREGLVAKRRDKLLLEWPGLKWRFESLADGWDLLSPRHVVGCD
jgi:hypothetical protein